MRRAAAAISAFAFYALAGNAPAQDAPNLAVTEPPAAAVTIPRAIEDGVRYLVEHQNKDGSFGNPASARPIEILANVPGSLEAFEAATTALCWMALRDQRDRGPDAEGAAQLALAWLVKNARVKRPNGMELYNVWSFGYGLRALAEALQSGAPGASPEAIRAEARSLVKALEIYQVPDGGWGYYDFEAKTYRPSGSSTSFTTATILIALHEARAAGIEVPQALIDKAVRSVDFCRKADGSYLYGWYLRYRPMMGVNEPKGSAMRSPGCNLALKLFGAGIGDDELRQGLELLVKHNRFAIAGVRRPIPHESWYQVSGYFYLYGHQYAALCLDLLGDDDRRRFWPPIAEAILKTRQPDGSFWDYPLYGYHKFYGTAYALIALARYPQDLMTLPPATPAIPQTPAVTTSRTSPGSAP